MKYLISRYNINIVKEICQRDNISYKVMPSSNDRDYLLDMAISRARFRELLDDVMCEQKRKRTQTSTPYVTAKTIYNPEKFQKVLGSGNKFRITVHELNKL